MKFQIPYLLASAAVAHATHIQFSVVPSPQGSANQLPALSSATLTTKGVALTAPISADGNFDFRNVSSGEYLVDIVGGAYVFQPLRLDVKTVNKVEERGAEKAIVTAEEVKAWGTWRGNGWGNLGEVMDVHTVLEGGREVKRVLVQVRGKKEFFAERQGFSIVGIFKNPMILMAGAAMLMAFGLPKLIENMDPEMKAEYEEAQKSNPMAKMLGGQSAQSAAQDFDAAAWLAGTTKKTGEKGGKVER